MAFTRLDKSTKEEFQPVSSEVIYFVVFFPDWYPKNSNSGIALPTKVVGFITVSVTNEMGMRLAGE